MRHELRLWESPAARPERKEFVHCDHEYLNFRGGKFSKSRGAFVEVPYFLSKYDPDPLRFYLTATAPETRDTEFSWEDFVERNNPVPSRSPEPCEGGKRGERAGRHLGQPGEPDAELCL
jgi:cysteinyl-tRNA synthetase